MVRTGQLNKNLKEITMKQVKVLILTAFLVLALSAGVQAGDMGSPGIRNVSPTDPGKPVATTNISPEASASGTTVLSETTIDLSNPVLRELFLAMLALI
jgi:hypothetical protein